MAAPLDSAPEVRPRGAEQQIQTNSMQMIYNTLRECIKDWSGRTLCNNWRYVAEGIYLDIHDKFFSKCGPPVPLKDPPLTIMVLLISPGIIFTLLLPLLCLPLTTFHKEMPGTLGL
ncbi:unnamed protein product [Gadus morhua 'NCC']